MPKVQSGDLEASYEPDDRYFHIYRSNYHNILLSREDIDDLRKLLDIIEEDAE